MPTRPTKARYRPSGESARSGMRSANDTPSGGATLNRAVGRFGASLARGRMSNATRGHREEHPENRCRSQARSALTPGPSHVTAPVVEEGASSVERQRAPPACRSGALPGSFCETHCRNVRTLAVCRRQARPVRFQADHRAEDLRHILAPRMPASLSASRRATQPNAQMSVRLSTGLPVCLLRAHVGSGPEDHARPGHQRWRCDGRRCRRRARSHAGSFERLRQAKVEHFDRAVGPHLMFAGLRSR